jgi:hypothetical protein
MQCTLQVSGRRTATVVTNHDALPRRRTLNWSGQRGVRISLLGWLAMIGVDFFVHGGLLAGLYTAPAPFLLPPAQAFSRIPLGYAAFFLLAILLLWLLRERAVAGARPGFVFGLQLGALAWGALVLGLASISSADPLLLLGWFVGQTVELAVGGAVIGGALAGQPLSRLLVRVLALDLVLVVATIVLQSLGLAPAVRL